MISAWWEYYEPRTEFDIARLRPATLGPRERFETVADAERESLRSEGVLRKRGLTIHADYLQDCREGYYACGKTFCPICARRYRRALIGEALRLFCAYKSAAIAVVLLERASRSEIDRLNPAKHEQWMRKRLSRAGFDQHPIIVAFEVAYKARKAQWVLHINVCALGCNDPDVLKAALDPGTRKGVECADVVDPARQLSYVPKFSTYHRPEKQQGSRKPRAVSLNEREHCELVSWMGRREFSELLLLINARRRGDIIRPSN